MGMESLENEHGDTKIRGCGRKNIFLGTKKYFPPHPLLFSSARFLWSLVRNQKRNMNFIYNRLLTI